MAEVAEALLAAAQVPRQRTWGVGIGFPGPLRITQDRAVKSVVNPDFFPGWTNVPVVEQLMHKLRLPVYLENTATAATIGESFYSAGQKIDSFFYVFLGYGLGGGVILDRQPLRGFQGNAGVIGLLLTSHHNASARLGDLFNPIRLLERFAQKGPPLQSIPEMERLTQQPHPSPHAWLGDAAAALAPALINVEYLYDPEAFIFGGMWSPAILDALVAQVEARMAPLRIEQKTHEPPLVRAQAGEDAAERGVAALPIHATLTPHFLPLKRHNHSFPNTSSWLEGGQAATSYSTRP